MTDPLHPAIPESPWEKERKGIIMGKDTTIGRYVIGEHELTMEKVTYHIGFSRKPGWMEEGGKA